VNTGHLPLERPLHYPGHWQHFFFVLMVRLGVNHKYLTHLFLHFCFVRPGTSSEILAQFLPLYFSAASLSLPSSSLVHLPTGAAVSSVLERKISCHLILHCCFVRAETSSEIDAQSLPMRFSTTFFSMMSSSAVHFYPHLRLSRLSWSASYPAIYSYTPFSFDQEPSRK
jgi:hypothetical protein